MEPDGSLAGSPTGATQIDGAQLALRMVQAAESAANAAQAVSSAVAAQSSSSSSGGLFSGDSSQLYKLLAKPQTFDPSSREHEISLWREWSWSFEQYLASLDSHYPDELKVIRSNLGTEIDQSVQDDKERQRGTFLYGLLSGVLKQRPLMLLKQVQNSNGFEAYRQLIAANEPQNKNRSMSLLSTIMSWPQFHNKSSLLSQIMRLDGAFMEYERLGSKLNDELKAAILLRSVTGQLKTWLQLQVSETTTYNNVREHILAYERSTAKWTEQMVLGNDLSLNNSHDTSGPMEVDRVFDSKGKQKGKKGKGKDQQKGKTKGKYDSGKGKGSGFKGSPNWFTGKGQSQWSGHNAGKGSGGPSNFWDGKSKGKGGKSKDKGKGRFDGTCHKCGKYGHKAETCRVRNVTESGASGSNDTVKQHTETLAPSQSMQNNMQQKVNRVVSFPIPIPSSSMVFSNELQPETFFDVSDDTFESSDVFMIVQMSDSLSSRHHDESSPCAAWSGIAMSSGVACGGTSSNSIGIDEYFPLKSDVCGGISCASSYILHPLFNYDDNEHYKDLVSDSYRFDLYDVTDVESTCRIFNDSVRYRPGLKPQLHVRAVTSQVHDIVLDSGSDATVLPVSLMDAGVPSRDRSSELRDAQGNTIHVDDVRDICFDVTTTNGQSITIKDRAHFSSAVDKPLISYGKLLKRGWGIMPSQDGDFLVHKSGHRVQLGFKQNSIMMQGHVRVLEEVRRLSVDIPVSWQNLGVGWYDLPNGTPLCMSHARHFVDVTKSVLLHEFPYRTTLAWHETEGWHMLELRMKVFYMDNPAKPIARGYKKLVTIMSKVSTSAENLGIVVLSSQTRSSGPSSSANPSRFELFETDNPAPAPEELAREGDEAPAAPDRPVRMDIPASLAVHRDDGHGATNGITIAGVTVYPNSAISVLRAACHYLEISQSGSKSKLWQRILSTLDKRKMAAEIEAASSAKLETVREPTMVHTPAAPVDEDEVMRHRLTHIPYKDWCEFCVAGKGKAERHERDPESLKEHELPVVSFDLCYTGVSGEAVDEKSNAKVVVLVLHDSHSSAVHAVPVRNKGEVQHMVREASRFIEHLGHGDICLRCDQEPTMLNLQTVLQRALLRLGRKVTCENSKILDHASNSWVEKAVDRVRNTANVFLHQLRTMLEVEVPISHPLVAWAFVHAAWTLNRYSVKAGSTPYELISGHSYHGKLCQFAQPVLGFVGDSTNKKGDPKWRKCIFLTKTLNNDMFVVSTESGGLQLTKSVKALYPDWKEQIQVYRTIVAYPWHVSGTLGNKIDAFSKRESRFAITGMGPGIDDSPGDDPPDEVPSALPDDAVLVGVMPPIHVESSATTTAAQPVATVPVLEPPGGSGGMDVEQAGLNTDESATVVEPPSKKAKISVRRIGDEEYLHVDVEMEDYCREVNFQDEFADWYFGDEEKDQTNDPSPDYESRLWLPFSDLEPNLTADELEELDLIADELEIRRLTAMGVLTLESNYTGELGKPLSARMVRAWRKKTRPIYDSSGVLIENEPAWLRRARLVGRDFNWLEARDDVYSPASSSSVSKLFPALAITNGFVDEAILGTLDISDAFLQVPQQRPRRVTFGNQSFVILRCLPGQRDASKLWYQHFTGKLQTTVGATICSEQPCILKCANDGAVLIHVDDIMFIGTEQWVTTKLLPGLAAEFKLTHSYVKRHEGGSFEFLKRLHVIEPGYSRITIYPEPKHVNSMVEKYTKANGKPTKLCKTPCSSTSLPSSSDPSQPLSESLASEYRSIVGIAMYMSQERFDIQYAVKSLACDLKNPTQQSWAALGRLVGYLRETEYFAVRMDSKQQGTSFMQSMMDVDDGKQQNFLEVFTDSDWSGSGDMRSTSSAVHVLNSIVVHSTSRTQKCISLSSTEAEWYSASSGVCDAMYLHHILSFLTDNRMETLCLHTDNSAVKMLAVKLGSGRLRHIRGRLLWLQQRVSCGELVIKQIKTIYNVSDLNTKSLSKDRFMSLLYMLNFVCHEQRVGLDEFERMQSREVLKSQVNMMCRLISEESGERQPRSHSSNKAAKQVLRILSTFSLMSLSEGALLSVCIQAQNCSLLMVSLIAVMANSKWLYFAVFMLYCLTGAGGMSEALSLEPNTLSDNNFMDFLLAVVMMSIIACVFSVICCMMNDGNDSIPVSSDEDNDEAARRAQYRYQSLSECSDPDLWQRLHHHEMSSSESGGEVNPSPIPTTSAPRPVRRPSPLLCYMSLSNVFGKLHDLMVRDHEQKGRGYAVVHHLFLVLRSFDENGITEESIRLLHQMVLSIMQMEAETNARSMGVPAITDVNTFALRFPMERYYVMVDENELQDDGAPDSTIQFFEGEMPDAFERGSPEYFAAWMSERLRKRICSAVVKGGDFKRYMMLNSLMKGVLKKCAQSELNRRRCMHMVMHLDETFLDEFLEGIPNTDYVDYSETYRADVDDYEENLDRDLGPRDPMDGTPENTLMIPAYSIIDGIPHYTIDTDELPEGAVLIGRYPEWHYYEWNNFRYRVRNFLTREEHREAERTG